MRRPSQNIELTFPWSPLLRYQQLGIPAIPTILLDGVFVEQSDDEIARRVQTIGGFPVILKQVGLSHGAGVQKIDSMRQLRDVLRTVDGRDIQKYALRQYLAVYRHARLVVLDGRVIDSIEYIVPEDDFRTNAGTVSVVPQKFDVEVEKAAIDTVNSLAAVMGGVDILIDVATQTPYVAECNSPCNFWRNQNTTGVPIAEKIIEYLAGDRT
jgi:glutathione synthase/RimK-type ligase-like ATP-grasp enzyme